MGQFLNPGNSAFMDAINSEIYVDKTGLIAYTNKVCDTAQKYICNSRPRRFGKSYTAEMLTAYYSRGCESKGIFSGLLIEDSDSFEKNLNQCNVIHLDMQWCMMDAGSPEKTVSYVNAKLVRELKSSYPGIVSEEAKTAFGALSEINTKVGERFIIIIDEWDVLIRDESAKLSVQTEYINFLRGMFKGSEPAKYIQLAYLTGILPIKKLKTQSALNNFSQFTMISPGAMASYIGFTQDEVKNLCGKYKKDFAEVRRWYDGYLLDNYHVYNPGAVINLMLNGTFQSYWSQTGTYESILPLIKMDFDGLRGAIIEMLSGTEISVNTDTFQNDVRSFADRDDVLTLLIHLGYLAYNQEKRVAYIPNEEIRLEFRNAVRVTKWNEMITFQQESERLLEAVLDGDEMATASEIENIHEEYASVIRYHDENSLSSVLTIAFLASMQYYFRPVRELPSGRRFADFVYIPKPEYRNDYPALVVELKWNKRAQTALDQIKEKRYPDSLRGYTGNILLVGISYDRKIKSYECRIEKEHCAKTE